MPVEEHDPFEEQFAQALRHAGGTLDDQPADLAVRGELRGRRLRRRRAAIVGGVTGVALVGLGGALVLPGLRPDGAPQASVAASPSRPTVVTGDQLLATLKRLLPKGGFSNEEARGTDEPPASYAQLVYDDGKGKAAIAVGLTRIHDAADAVTEATQCPDKVFVSYDACHTSRLADGSVLKIFQGYEYPDRRVDTKLWIAHLLTRKGQYVTVQEWNAPAEKDRPISREQPPLSPDRLKAIVSAPEWRAAVDAIPVRRHVRTAEPRPTQAVPGGSVSSRLASLLPKGLTVVTKGRRDSEFGYVIVDDGNGASFVQVNVQTDMSDVRNQLFGQGSRTLPDGTRVATRQQPGEKGAAGVVQWTVDTMRPDGRRVVITAFNSRTQTTAATRKTPALTMKQLEAIALDSKWFASGERQSPSSK
ncbi:hypothetical protein [Streptomyces sp. NPDC046805]|uniref:hypothetical protein n=1 Tax=Streptomyces sp. NPDC046805 TaxID=3155134 RepID=UPI0033C94C44